MTLQELKQKQEENFKKLLAFEFDRTPTLTPEAKEARNLLKESLWNERRSLDASITIFKQNEEAYQHMLKVKTERPKNHMREHYDIAKLNKQEKRNAKRN